MPANILKYSNGWGHLIMSLALLATGVILILMRDSTSTAVGISLISTVAGYWFVTSAANAQQQVAAAQQSATIQVNPPAPAVTIAPASTTTTQVTTGGPNGSSI